MGAVAVVLLAGTRLAGLGLAAGIPDVDVGGDLFQADEFSWAG